MSGTLSPSVPLQRRDVLETETGLSPALDLQDAAPPGHAPETAVPPEALDKPPGGADCERGPILKIVHASVPVGPSFVVARQPVAMAVSKRTLDVLVALALLIFFAPLLIAIATVVVLETRGPALFRQRRTGLGGRVFTIYKFRTMTVMEDGPLVAVTRGDSRVTGVGAILRRNSLDELPQLLNVLKGDMSLVGPRPHAIAHDVQFGSMEPAYRRRFAARPGVTGLAQISGHRGEVRTPAALRARLDADLRYVEGWSFALDLRILCATALKVWLDDKAY